MQQDKKTKHKPTNVGRIALERQARQYNSRTVAYINFALWVQIVNHAEIRTMGLSRTLTRSLGKLKVFDGKEATVKL